MRSTLIKIHELVRVSTKLSFSLCIVAAERAAPEREREMETATQMCVECKVHLLVKELTRWMELVDVVEAILECTKAACL